MSAEALQASIHDWQSEEGITDATMVASQLEVLTEAVQALFYEQRTANLIALQQQWLAEGLGPSNTVDVQIRERLGLK